MNNKKSFSSSPTKVLFISGVFFFTFCLLIAFSRGKFELDGLILGAVIGTIFALFPMVFGFGQKVELSDEEISYSSNLLALFVNKFRNRMLLSEITEVRLGIPRYDKTKATFAAINISSLKEEITFNPDLFDNSTLQALFKELRTRNLNIKFDSYALALIDMGKDNGIFPKMVFGNFIWTVLLIILTGVIALILFLLGFVSFKVVLIILGLQTVIVPIIFNWLVNLFKRKRIE